ncbi:MAG: zf-HC2 domain-containing protein [Dehalococcoidia bacterium]
MVDELSCQELVELVTAYLDDALDSGERARFEAHLDDCSGCEAYLDQMRTAIRLTGALREEAIGADARGRLLAAFRGWKAQTGG